MPWCAGPTESRRWPMLDRVMRCLGEAAGVMLAIAVVVAVASISVWIVGQALALLVSLVA